MKRVILSDIFINQHLNDDHSDIEAVFFFMVCLIFRTALAESWKKLLRERQIIDNISAIAQSLKVGMTFFYYSKKKFT